MANHKHQDKTASPKTSNENNNSDPVISTELLPDFGDEDLVKVLTN